MAQARKLSEIALAPKFALIAIGLCYGLFIGILVERKNQEGRDLQRQIWSLQSDLATFRRKLDPANTVEPLPVRVVG